MTDNFETDLEENVAYVLVSHDIRTSKNEAYDQVRCDIETQKNEAYGQVTHITTLTNEAYGALQSNAEYCYVTVT